MNQQHPSRWGALLELESPIPVRSHTGRIHHATFLIAIDILRVARRGLGIDLCFELIEEALFKIEIAGKVSHIRFPREFFIKVHLMPEMEVGALIEHVYSDRNQ